MAHKGKILLCFHMQYVFQFLACYLAIKFIDVLSRVSVTRSVELSMSLVVLS